MVDVDLRRVDVEILVRVLRDNVNAEKFDYLCMSLLRNSDEEVGGQILGWTKWE